TAYMPRLKALLTDRGTTFANAFVTTPLCSPSRASILTGQYAHNHGLLSNQLPLGGFEKWAASGKEQTTIATSLKAAGYRTIMIGKYMNAYQPGSPPYVAPGWDDWHAMFSSGSQDPYFNYSFNDNGTINAYGTRPEDYATDVMATKAVEALQLAEATDTQPFFLYLAVGAPHTPAFRAPKYEGQFTDLGAPRTPSFGEPDVSDKPAYLQSFPLFTDRDERRIDFLYRDRVATLQSVDELLQRVMQQLETSGELGNTLVVFTSDNGFFLGPHRFNRGKGAPYEEALRVPLVMRGPGVAAGAVRSELVTNLDFAPTFAALAGATLQVEADGRSLASLMQGGAAGEWRHDFLAEFWQNAEDGDESDVGIPTWQALRNETTLYADYETGEGELYDLRADRYELQSQYSVTSSATLAPLEQRLAALKACRGASCR
ncbi:MAG TPA: sulfatase, partial [Vicinamibacteria bacterium]|nr:sulfatase [Vicinamibacteria bacterium]